ncbi:MAG: alanine:cation symporter family protein [Dorea sp.]
MYPLFGYPFQPQAIIGGGFGAALKVVVSQGAKRGLFSNEAGMGATIHAHSFNQLMVIPNALALFALTGMVVKGVNSVTSKK